MVAFSIELIGSEDEKRRDGWDQDPLFEFEKALTSSTTQFEAETCAANEDQGDAEILTGNFLVTAAPLLVPIATAIIGYLTARATRKVKVKIRDVEIEASSADEVAKIIELLKKHQK